MKHYGWPPTRIRGCFTGPDHVISSKRKVGEGSPPNPNHQVDPPLRHQEESKIVRGVDKALAPSARLTDPTKPQYNSQNILKCQQGWHATVTGKKGRK